jgi:hypothetical protein
LIHIKPGTGAERFNTGMHTPEYFLAYTPRGAGLRCAVVYLHSDADVFGWFIGPRQDQSIASLYFMLQDVYATRPYRYEAVEEADLHSEWLLDEPRRHELARIQEIFSREWLVYPDDPRAGAERQAYDEAELGVGEINVTFERLGRFSKLQPTWTCYSPQFERTVLRRLAKHWPLEYRPGVDETKPRRKRALT